MNHLSNIDSTNGNISSSALPLQDSTTKLVHNSFTTNNNFTEKSCFILESVEWMKTTIVMTYSAALAVLSISYVLSDGKLRPQYLFGQHSMSFTVFLMVLMVAFFSAINGIFIFNVEEFPNIGRVCNFVALVAVILSFTVLLWAILPPDFGWPPWVFFAFTFGALAYRCAKSQVSCQ